MERDQAERERVRQLNDKARQVKTRKLRDQSAQLAKQAETLESRLADEAADEEGPEG